MHDAQSEKHQDFIRYCRLCLVWELRGQPAFRKYWLCFVSPCPCLIMVGAWTTQPHPAMVRCGHKCVYWNRCLINLQYECSSVSCNIINGMSYGDHHV